MFTTERQNMLIINPSITAINAVPWYRTTGKKCIKMSLSKKCTLGEFSCGKRWQAFLWLYLVPQCQKVSKLLLLLVPERKGLCHRVWDELRSQLNLLPGRPIARQMVVSQLPGCGELPPMDQEIISIWIVTCRLLAPLSSKLMLLCPDWLVL